MPFLGTLPIGKTVVAATEFGPVIRGQLGIITGRRQGTWRPWRRTAYICTFLGDIRVTTTRGCIRPYDHGCSRALLEDPLWFLHTGNAPVEGSKCAVELRRVSH